MILSECQQHGWGCIVITAQGKTASARAPDAAPVISSMKVTGGQASGHEVSNRMG